MVKRTVVTGSGEGVAYLWSRCVIMSKKRRCTIAGITVHLLFWSQMLIISRMYDDDQVVDCAEKSYADAVCVIFLS